MSEPKPAEAAPIPAPTQAPAQAVDAKKTELAAEAPKPGAVDAAQKEPQPLAVPPAAGATALDDARAECKRFLDAFGPKGGEWFAAGKTFAEAQGLHAQDLRAENEALKSRLAALDRGEKAPVTFQPEKRDDARAKRRAELKAKVGDNLAAFAAEIDCTRKKEG